MELGYLTNLRLTTRILETTVPPTMEHELRNGLSIWSIVAIVCNSVVGFLIVILFVILYKACKVPSHQEKVPAFAAKLEQKKDEQKYMLTAA